MIRITCTNCRTTLEMDDAFAGGTCRCKHCGTIQTVPGKPSKARRAAAPTGIGVGPAPARPGPSPGPRTLYAEQRRAPPPGSGTGLDELADVVAGSSGLSNPGLRAGRDRSSGVSVPPDSPAAAAAAAGGENRSRMVMVVAGALAGVVLGAIVTAVIATRSSPASPQTAAPAVSGDPAPDAAVDAGGAAGAVASPAAPGGPRFASLPLNESSVVFVIDRGASARESLGYMVGAALRAAGTLGRDRRYQLVFWDNGQDAVAHPSSGPAFATPDAIAATGRAVENVVAFGRSDAVPAVRRAVASNPGSIVLITAKGWELDDAFADAVMRARGGWQGKVHVVSVGSDAGNDATERLTRSTGGGFATVSIGDLKDFARDE